MNANVRRGRKNCYGCGGFLTSAGGGRIATGVVGSKRSPGRKNCYGYVNGQRPPRAEESPPGRRIAGAKISRGLKNGEKNLRPGAEAAGRSVGLGVGLGVRVRVRVRV